MGDVFSGAEKLSTFLEVGGFAPLLLRTNFCWRPMHTCTGIFTLICDHGRVQIDVNSGLFYSLAVHIFRVLFFVFVVFYRTDPFTST